MTRDVLEALGAAAPAAENEGAASQAGPCENCGFAPPGADTAKTQFPQPPERRAEATEPGLGFGQRQGEQSAARRGNPFSSAEKERIAAASVCTGFAMTGEAEERIATAPAEPRNDRERAASDTVPGAPGGAQRSGSGGEKEEGRSVAELSPQGESGAARVSSDVEARLLAVKDHLDSLHAQAAELRREFPDFDLDEALRDPDFLRLTAPGLGVDLRRAYYAIHREELDRRAARQAAEETRRQLARSLAAGGARPREGGGHEAAAALAADYRHMSRPQQQALKQRIIEAAARGEKIYP